ncbi:hypothetical protein [Kangiella sp. HZ709]|uniref:hypothetical protein n=1 Tax=Kangiella sp. HZ709 TaxID=2666328 RepID=UPI0012B1512B|nr:hypothetical protein [Kangiella sp. HZ709]MRX27953.1 hypothetical protein [Kangiella sp. HZ709]
MLKKILLLIFFLSGCKTVPSVNVEQIKKKSSNIAFKEAMKICEVKEYIACFKGGDKTSCNGALGMSVLKKNKNIASHGDSNENLEQHYITEYLNYYLYGQHILHTALAGSDNSCVTKALENNLNVEAIFHLNNILKAQSNDKQ